MDKGGGHFLFIKRFIMLVFIVSLASIVVLSFVFITSLYSNNNSIVEAKMESIRVSFDREVINPLSTMAFALRNPLLHGWIQQKNHVELIRWINEYRRATDVDVCLLMSVEGEVLAKTEFFKTPYGDKFGYIVSEVLKGNVISSLDFFGIDELDEGMRFIISQRVSQEVAVDQEDGQVFMIIRGMPVHRRTGEKIAIFLTGTILNNNSRFIAEIAHPAAADAVAIVSYEEVVAYLASTGETARNLISKIDFEKVREMSKGGSGSFKDRANRVAYVPLKGHISENTIGFFAFSYTNDLIINNSWKFFVLALLFFISLAAICVHYYKYTNTLVLKPWDRVISLFTMIESGAKNLPLATREDKMSPFGDIFKIVYKLAPILKKNAESEGQSEKDADQGEAGIK